MRRARCARLSPGRDVAFFFYGTLIDRDLLSEVLRRRVARRALLPARLRGYRRAAVHGANYPVVLAQRGATVRGVVLRRVKPAERARLSAYEGDGYEQVCALAELPRRGRAQVLLFKPKPGAYAVTTRPWSLASWRLHRNRRQREAVRA
jgi:hypothetical protein